MKKLTRRQITSFIKKWNASGGVDYSISIKLDEHDEYNIIVVKDAKSKDIGFYKMDELDNFIMDEGIDAGKIRKIEHISEVLDDAKGKLGCKKVR